MRQYYITPIWRKYAQAFAAQENSLYTSTELMDCLELNDINYKTASHLKFRHYFNRFIAEKIFLVTKMKYLI